jgi:catechol 2,3-dioxygenase-like lactoylglutathione lyase family enzyme
VRQKIAALSILAPDYDLAIDFYVGALGFELVEDTDLGGGKRWVLVRHAGAETALLLAKAADDAQRAAIGRQAGGRVFLFLETDDFERDFSQMRERGVTFAEEPRQESYGVVAVYEDPFGNRWDLIQPL